MAFEFMACNLFLPVPAVLRFGALLCGYICVLLTRQIMYFGACMLGVSFSTAALLSTGADIICLQEVYGDNHADFIVESTRHKLPFVGESFREARRLSVQGLSVSFRNCG